MRDFHAMVIDHIRQVVRWMTIRLQQDRVIINTIDQVQLASVGLVLARFPVDEIVEHGVSLYLQTNHMCLALGCAVGRLFGGDVGAFSVVSRGQSCLAAVARERIEPLCGTETTVGMAVRDEVIGVGPI